MNRIRLPTVLPILLILLSSFGRADAAGGPAAPWADAVPAGHWMAPFDSFEENLSLSFSEARFQASENETERQGALRDWRALLEALSAERSAERQALEARYASGALSPARFNSAVDTLRERGRWLGEAREQAALANATPEPPPTLPPPVSGLSNTTYESYVLNWSWREPGAPYNRTEVYVNGIFIYSLPGGATRFGLTRTAPGMDYTLSLRVVDDRGAASPWTNHTARTAPNPPPGSVTNLTVANRSQSHIHWNWTNPGDPNYNHTEVWVNGVWRLNTRASDYRLGDLSPGTRASLFVRAVDRTGQPGNWANLTSTTLPLPTPGGGLFTPVPVSPQAPSCPRCEDVDCDSCGNGICYKWKVTQGEGKQTLTCGSPSPSPGGS